ncbi:unnamed protein product [Hymenolepis diminuta]|uniref:Uncharacterized protein n=1 Tax=Hymenolepis diminuta TaxID=6216 RepID=A0A564XZV4_HYMDI|nr:unnamed protein product [Hymenolepis diminuta]
MVRRGQSVQGSASCNSEKQKIPNAKRSRGELDPEAGPQTATVHPERTRYWASIDRVDSLPIRRISEAVTFKILILWRISLSSRQPYRRCHCQNCNDNGHKVGFCQEFFPTIQLGRIRIIRECSPTTACGSPDVVQRREGNDQDIIPYVCRLLTDLAM